MGRVAGMPSDRVHLNKFQLPCSLSFSSILQATLLPLLGIRQRCRTEVQTHTRQVNEHVRTRGHWRSRRQADPDRCPYVPSSDPCDG
jgi:hypothetical protein